MKKGLIALGLSVLLAAGCVDAKIPTPTTRPTLTPRATATLTLEAPTATVVVQVAFRPDLPGDPVEGERLFRTRLPSAGTACNACHRIDSDDRLIGPGLLTVGSRAQTRFAGQSAEQYLHTSIVDPSAYIVDDYPNLMPKNWGSVFTEEQINDLVAYLLTLTQ